MGVFNVTLSGSYRKHLEQIFRTRSEFQLYGANVLRPISSKIEDTGGAFVRLEGDPQSRAVAQQQQLDAIRNSQLLYVVDPGGYNGGSVMLEVGYAYACGVPVFFSEPPFEQSAAALARGVGSPLAALHDVFAAGSMSSEELVAYEVMASGLRMPAPQSWGRLRVNREGTEEGTGRLYYASGDGESDIAEWREHEIHLRAPQGLRGESIEPELATKLYGAIISLAYECERNNHPYRVNTEEWGA